MTHTQDKIQALFGDEPAMQTTVLRIVATVPTCRDEDTLLAMLYEVEQGDIFAEVAEFEGFTPRQFR